MDNRASIPPPPYSETDTNASAVLTPAASQYDSTVSHTRGHPSLVSETSTESILYTPDPSPSPSEYQQSRHGTDHIASPSASAYFESRPLQANLSPQLVRDHIIIITRETDHRDVPYLEEWESTDITRQDWSTFLNYLLPDHITNVNGEIADRKLRAEMIDERM
jgi:hypothetical protein